MPEEHFHTDWRWDHTHLSANPILAEGVRFYGHAHRHHLWEDNSTSLELMNVGNIPEFKEWYEVEKQRTVENRIAAKVLGGWLDPKILKGR